MQNRRDTIPNQRTKPASNAGLMDGGRPDDIRDNGRCDPIGNRGNGKKLFQEGTMVLYRCTLGGELGFQYCACWGVMPYRVQ